MANIEGRCCLFLVKTAIILTKSDNMFSMAVYFGIDLI